MCVRCQDKKTLPRSHVDHVPLARPDCRFAKMLFLCLGPYVRLQELQGLLVACLEHPCRIQRQHLQPQCEPTQARRHEYW